MKSEEKAKRKISYSEDVEYYPVAKNAADNMSTISSDDEFENFANYKPEKLMQKILKSERDLTFYLAKNKEYAKKASAHLEKATKITEKIKVMTKAMEVVISTERLEDNVSRKRERSLSNSIDKDEDFSRKQKVNSKRKDNQGQARGNFNDDDYPRNYRQDPFSREDPSQNSGAQRTSSYESSPDTYRNSGNNSNSGRHRNNSVDSSDRRNNFNSNNGDNYQSNGRHSRDDSRERSWSGQRDNNRPKDRNIQSSGYIHAGRQNIVEHSNSSENANKISPRRQRSETPVEEIVLEGEVEEMDGETVSEDDGANHIPFKEQLASYIENTLGNPPPATVPFEPVVAEWEIKSSGSRQTLNSLKSVKLTNFGRNARDVLEWITDDILVVASNYEKLLEHSSDSNSGQYELHQLALIHDCELQTLGKNKVFTNKIIHVTQYPHTKNITTIGKMPISDNIRWLTGGNDKLITLWTHTGGTGQALKTQRVHFEHTNAVTSIHYQDFTDTLFSGGKDKRLIGYNLDRDLVVTANGKNDHQIREILPIPGQKHLLLVSFIDKNSSLKLYDTRLQIYVSQWHLPDPPAEAKAPSLYQKPSLHRNGNLVALGDPMSDIHIWDLRYASCEKTPSQVISTHRNRVMGSRFYDRLGHSLLSWCTNNDFYMTSYA
ncbi:hypothetical protein HDV01_001140 [Terramyces sp. JEL0728]|nr:hypothetical protein HDV01_001140 [Terramyces sp. JEL0728]